MQLQHPHDRFVREFFSEPAHAREFLSAVLPAALADTLDWTRLRGEPATFIDENLREQHSDLLFSAPGKAGEPHQVYLLFEHKSMLDQRLLQQLLGYLARIYAAQNEPAPVIAVVFYHGDAPHPTGQRFIDDLSLSPERRALFQPFIPDFGYVLFDLARIEPRAWGSLALRVFLAALGTPAQSQIRPATPRLPTTHRGSRPRNAVVVGRTGTELLHPGRSLHGTSLKRDDEPWFGSDAETLPSCPPL